LEEEEEEDCDEEIKLLKILKNIEDEEMKLLDF